MTAGEGGRNPGTGLKTGHYRRKRGKERRVLQKAADAKNAPTALGESR